MKFQYYAQRDSYDDFPMVTCFQCNSGVYGNPFFLKLYLRKYSEKGSENQIQGLNRSILKWVFVLPSETSYRKRYRENPMMTCFSLNSGAFKDPNFLKSYFLKYSATCFEI